MQIGRVVYTRADALDDPDYQVVACSPRAAELATTGQLAASLRRLVGQPDERPPPVSSYFCVPIQPAAGGGDTSPGWLVGVVRPADRVDRHGRTGILDTAALALSTAAFTGTLAADPWQLLAPAALAAWVPDTTRILPRARSLHAGARLAQPDLADVLLRVTAGRGSAARCLTVAVPADPALGRAPDRAAQAADPAVVDTEPQPIAIAPVPIPPRAARAGATLAAGGPILVRATDTGGRADITAQVDALAAICRRLHQSLSLTDRARTAFVTFAYQPAVALGRARLVGVLPTTRLDESRWRALPSVAAHASGRHRTLLPLSVEERATPWAAVQLLTASPLDPVDDPAASRRIPRAPAPRASPRARRGRRGAAPDRSVRQLPGLGRLARWIGAAALVVGIAVGTYATLRPPPPRPDGGAGAGTAGQDGSGSALDPGVGPGVAKLDPSIGVGRFVAQWQESGLPWLDPARPVERSQLRRELYDWLDTIPRRWGPTAGAWPVPVQQVALQASMLGWQTRLAEAAAIREGTAGSDGTVRGGGTDDGNPNTSLSLPPLTMEWIVELRPAPAHRVPGARVVSLGMAVAAGPDRPLGRSRRWRADDLGLVAEARPVSHEIRFAVGRWFRTADALLRVTLAIEDATARGAQRTLVRDWPLAPLGKYVGLAPIPDALARATIQPLPILVTASDGTPVATLTIIAIRVIGPQHTLHSFPQTFVPLRPALPDLRR